MVKTASEKKDQWNKLSGLFPQNLLVILCIVPIAACILVFLPVFPMLTCGQQNHVFCVMNMIQSVPSVRADASEIALALEHKHVLPKGWDGVVLEKSPLATSFWMLLGKKWDGHVEAWPKGLCADAGLG